MSTNASSLTVSEWLTRAAKRLQDSDIATARLDCLVLLEDALKKDRSYILAHPDFTFHYPVMETLNRQIERRIKHEPLAYIRGKTEFYGREFLVNAHTLEPRPETETMLELLMQLVDSKQLTVDSSTTLVDVGTGSGCIAITAKLELPALKVIGIDIDQKCLSTAKKNAEKLGADVVFYQGNLLQPLPPSTFHLPPSRFAILANLPYVPDKYELNAAAKFEPRYAIFGGEDGLDLYRELFAQLASQKSKVKSPKYVLTESLPFQHKTLAEIAEVAGYRLQKSDDFIQIFYSVSS